MASVDNTTVQSNTQLLSQLQTLLNNIVDILDGEAKLVDTTPSLVSTDNIDKLNLVLSDTLDTIDQVVLSEQTVPPAP